MPPKKKPKVVDPEVAKKLKEIEERRMAIEVERLKKEQEMLALLEEQEALLKAKLAEEDDEELEEGEAVEDEVEDVKVENEPSTTSPSTSGVNLTSTPEPTTVATKREPNRSGMVVLEKTWDIYANRLFGNLYKERETKFFVVKSASRDNIDLAFEKKLWATTKVNEIRWNEAYMAHTNVLLFFSAQGSGAFQGVARIAAKSSTGPKVGWTIPANLLASSLSAVFSIDWLSQQEITFDKLTHLRNTWNQNKLVKVARDGQEVSWKTGCALALMFPIDGSGEYDLLITKMKKRRSEIGPKQAVTASSRSAKRRKNLNKPVRTAKGINPSGYKPNSMSRGGASANKRFRFDPTGRTTGANTAPLGNQPTTTNGVSSLFNFTG